MNPEHSAPQIKLPPYALQMFVIVGLPNDSRKAFPEKKLAVNIS